MFTEHLLLAGHLAEYSVNRRHAQIWLHYFLAVGLGTGHSASPKNGVAASENGDPHS